jgi:hypothetical protein
MKRKEGIQVKSDRQNAGYALVIVMVLTALLAVLLAAVLLYSGNQIRIATTQGNMERALYVAQAGAERAAAYVANEGEGPWSSSGHIGDGTYVVAVIPSAMPQSSPRTVGGWIDLNPSGSSSSEFAMRKPDGTMIDKLDLGPDYPGYTGPAAWVHVKPGGSGIQSALMLDAVAYTMGNQYAYDIFAACMDVYLYNDHIDPAGHAIGKWKLSVASTCASFIAAD